MTTLRQDLEALLAGVLEKAYSTCGSCGEQIYKLEEPLETLKHPTYSRLTYWLHAGFSPNNVDAYWCHGGYTKTVRPMTPIIQVEHIQDILNADDERRSNG